MLAKFTKKRVLIGIALLLAVIVLSSFFKGESGVTYDTVTAERIDLKQEINATGRIEAISQIDLAFEKSGRVGEVNVRVGDTVSSGQALVVLESAEAAAELAQSRASVDSARAALQQYEASLLNQRAKLAELVAGTRVEEISLYESRVQNAESSLLSAKEGMINTMQDAYTKSEDAVRTKSDQMISSPKSSSPDLKFIATNSTIKGEILSARINLESALTSWKISLDALTNESSLDNSIAISKVNLDLVKVFLENLSTALSGALTSPTVTQTTIDAWAVSISGARISISASLSSYATAKEKLNNSATALIISKNELALKQAPRTAEQISAQEAAIQQAEANVVSQRAEINLRLSAVQGAEARYAKNILRSPISGIVTKQDAKRGAIVAANQLIVSVISEGEYEIEAYIVEADIVGLEIGDKALLTLDAYGDDVVFEAVVTEIDPAAEQIEGVANYRITLELSADDDRIKAGMTADIDIVTDEREQAVAIPQRAVIFRGSIKVVRVLNLDVVSEVEVETGIRGERGLIEIVSGINEGDIVVTAVNE